jgi:hypothetical protein
MFFNSISCSSTTALLLIGITLLYHTPIALAFAPSLHQHQSTIELNAKNVGKGDNDNINEQSRRELFKSLPSTTATTLAAMFSAGVAATTVPKPADAFFFFKKRPITTTSNEAVLGPLNELVGKWEGNQGFVLISVPSPGSIPSSTTGDFKLLSFPYRETFEIESIGPEGASNKGGSIDQVNGVCTYTKTVWAPDPTKPGKELVIHKEDGMFFYLDDVKTNPGSKPVGQQNKPPFSVGRSAVIPHGNTAMIFGDCTKYEGPPSFPDIQTAPFTTPATNFPLGYSDVFVSPPFIGSRPAKALQDALDKTPNVASTFHFSMDSKNGTGGVLNTDFITKRADTREYKADLWVEDLGEGKKQLQYVETASIFFHFNKDIEINWPHVMVNTLTKVS